MILASANEILTNNMPYILIGVAVLVLAIFITVLVIVAKTNKLAKRALENKNNQQPVPAPDQNASANASVPQTLVAVTVVAQSATDGAQKTETVAEATAPVEEPVEESVEEVSEEPAPAEEPVEEPVEEVSEEPAPAEETVEEPVEEVFEEPAPAEETVEESAEKIEEESDDEPVSDEVAIDDEEDDDDFDDTVAGADDFTASLNRKPSKPFVVKMQETTELNRDYYSSIKNKFLQYRKITARISKKCESFRCGRTLIAKINIVGKTMRVYLALDPKKYPVNIYFQKDAGDKKAYEEVPMMMRVKSDRALRRTYTLIEGLMAERDILVKSRFIEEDYARDIMNRPVSQ